MQEKNNVTRRNSLISNISQAVGDKDYVLANGTKELDDMVRAANMPAEALADDTLSDGESSIASKQSYRPGNDESEDPEAQLPPVVKTGTRFFSPRLREQRKKILISFFKVNFILLLVIFIIFTIFWGSTYRTASHYHKIKLIAVIQDDDITFGMENITMPMTSALPGIIENVPGHWNVYSSTTFADTYNVPQDMESINKKIIDLIYHEAYWLAINVKPNATSNLYQAITSENTTFFNTTDQFQLIYESGRDPTTVPGYILKLGQTVEDAFASFYSKQYLPSMVKNITTSEINLSNTLMSGDMEWDAIDYRPFYDRLLLTVTQVGTVYLVILTVFQFMNFAPLHGEMAKLLKGNSRILYRVLFSLVTYFFLSLFYCTVSAMYQVDFTRAFGRGGFMVYWMTTWLFMWAVGGANENVVGLMFAWRPQFLGIWMLGFIAMNICTAFFPFVLNSNFYRFGYFMPVHNLVDIYRVIFLDLSRWKMGRNYGILIAWIVLNTATLPFFMKVTGMLMMKQMKPEADAKDNSEDAH